MYNVLNIINVFVSMTSKNENTSKLGVVSSTAINQKEDKVLRFVKHDENTAQRYFTQDAIYHTLIYYCSTATK